MLWLCLQLVVKLFIADSKTDTILRKHIFRKLILLATEMLCVIPVNNEIVTFQKRIIKVGSVLYNIQRILIDLTVKSEHWIFQILRSSRDVWGHSGAFWNKLLLCCKAMSVQQPAAMWRWLQPCFRYSDVWLVDSWTPCVSYCGLFLLKLNWMRLKRKSQHLTNVMWRALLDTTRAV